MRPHDEKPRPLDGDAGRTTCQQFTAAVPPRQESGEPRGTKPVPPYLWASKSALRRIREALDREGNVASGLAVYFALCEAASNAGADTFAITHGELAALSGLSPRTVRSRLAELANIGLITVSTPLLKCASTYTLLAFSDRQPLPNERQRQKKALLPPSETTLKEQRKNGEGTLGASQAAGNTQAPAITKPCPAVAGPASKIPDEQWLDILQKSEPYKALDVRKEYARMVTWCSVNGKQPSRRRFVNWLNRCDRPMQTAAPPAVQTPAGQPNASVALLRDQKELERIEAALREARARYNEPGGTAADAADVRRLSKRRAELIAALGFQA